MRQQFLSSLLIASLSLSLCPISFADAAPMPEAAPIPLLEAAESGHIRKVKNLLAKNKADVNAANKSGDTALMLAASEGHTAIVKLLLDAGADPNAQNKNKNTALLKVIFNEEARDNGELLKIAKLLVDAGIDVNHQNNEGDSALLIAVMMDDQPLAELLTKAGANPKLQNLRGESVEKLRSGIREEDDEDDEAEVDEDESIPHEPEPPVWRSSDASAEKLLRAACEGNLKALRAALKDASANAKNDKGQPALHLALSQKQPEAAKALIKAGADVNARGMHGSTALMEAIKVRDFPMVQALIKAGADVKAKDQDGCTAIHLAADPVLDEIVKALLKAGADPNARFQGKTPIMHALEEQKWDVAKLLLKSGADPKSQSDNGFTLLMFAVPTFVTGGADPKAPERMFQTLLDAGADVKPQNKRNGASALHYAASVGHTEIVKLLLKAGADVNAKDFQGRTPLDVARGEKTRAVLEAASKK